jgi:hypothetical protein
VSALRLQGIPSHPEPEEEPFFPKRFKFVGSDVSANRNCPAMSKHDLLRHWPIPELVCNVASFVGFLQFYSNFIPHFKVRLLPLRKIMSQEYTEPVGDMWTPKVNSSFESSSKQSSATHAFVGLTIASSLFCIPISPPRGLGMSYASQETTRSP